MTSQEIEKIKQEAFDEAITELKQENSNQLEIIKKLDKINRNNIEQNMTAEKIATNYPADVIEMAIKIKEDEIASNAIPETLKGVNKTIKEFDDVFKEVYDEADRIVAKLGCKSIEEATKKLDRMEKNKKRKN